MFFPTGRVKIDLLSLYELLKFGIAYCRYYSKHRLRNSHKIVQVCQILRNFVNTFAHLLLFCFAFRNFTNTKQNSYFHLFFYLSIFFTNIHEFTIPNCRENKFSKIYMKNMRFLCILIFLYLSTKSLVKISKIFPRLYHHILFV